MLGGQPALQAGTGRWAAGLRAQGKEGSEASGEQAAEGRRLRGCSEGKAEGPAPGDSQLQREGRGVMAVGGMISGSALASSWPAPRDVWACRWGESWRDRSVVDSRSDSVSVTQGLAGECRSPRQRWTACGPGPACPAEL